MRGKMPKRPYLPRILDKRLQRCLSLFGAVEVAGTKWSGKTRCAQQVCASETVMTPANTELYQSAPHLALLGDRPHLVDEWQDAQGRRRRGRRIGPGRPRGFLETGAGAGTGVAISRVANLLPNTFCPDNPPSRAGRALAHQ